MNHGQQQKSRLVLILFIVGAYFGQCTVRCAASQGHFQSVYERQNLHEGLFSFLSSILPLLPAQPLSGLIDGATSSSQNDQEVYAKLIRGLPAADGYALKTPDFSSSPTYPLLYRIKLLVRSILVLRKQTQLMTKQTKEFVGPKKIRGYLEIGSVGRYVTPLRKELLFSGPVFIMAPEKSPYDTIERESIFDLGTVLPLNYEPIDPAIVPDRSVDLISCFIGLHHVPTDRLSDFVASLARVIKPGGLLLLREHDGTDELIPLLHVVHSVFNAVTGVSEEAEAEEVRNFKPLDFWIALLQEHGFMVNEKRLEQENDPTNNKLLCFVKVPNAIESDVIELEKTVIAEDSGYERDLAATYLTPIEWRSVDELHELSAFLDHTPWFEYPYWKSIYAFWKHTKNATVAAYQQCGAKNALFSSAAITNYFIGGVVTGLYTQLGLLSIGPRYFYHLPGNREAKKIKVVLQDSSQVVEKLKDSRVVVLKRYERTGIAFVEFPRYKPFTELITAVVKKGVTILEIAGQKEICVQIESDCSEADFICPKDCSLLHMTPPLPLRTTVLRSEVRVVLTALSEFLKAVEEQQYRVIHIFDY